MKVSIYGVSGLSLGKHNLKDPRLDQVDKLVEAKKKTYVQVDVLEEAEASQADAILVSRERQADVILHDLEFIEMRLGREPQPGEKILLDKIRSALESETFVCDLGLSPAEQEIIASYNLLSNKPVTVADSDDPERVDESLLRLLAKAGYQVFLTVGGKENRAWLIRQGITAWEAAAAVHSDIQKGFIRAEIISFDDLVQTGGETQAKRAGKMRLETKDYVMRDCDIVSYRFNK